MSWSKIGGLALAAVGGLALASASHDAVGAESQRCVTVYTEPFNTHIRTGMGTATSATVPLSVNVDGTSTTSAVTLQVFPSASPPRVQCSIDFGGGDTWSFGANMTPVTAHTYSFTTADSFVGTGIYAGATGSLTFARSTGPSWLVTNSTVGGPNVLEWGVTGTVCIPPDVTEDVCENGKPASLLLRYTGEGPSGTSHSQDAGNVVVTGDANFATPVRIRVTDRRKPFDSKARVYFDGTVALNGLYTVDGTALGLRNIRSTTFVYIFDGSGNLLESDEFHTSCSQPLETGDKYGSTELVDFTTAAKKGK